MLLEDGPTGRGTGAGTGLGAGMLRGRRMLGFLVALRNDTSKFPGFSNFSFLFGPAKLDVGIIYH